MYVDEVPFLMLKNSNEDIMIFLMADDAYLTSLCQHVQLPFVQDMDKRQTCVFYNEGLVLFASFVVWLVHHPDLPCV